MYYIFLAFRQMGLSFTSLKGSPRELYLNLLLKFLDSFGYFCLSQILVILMHSEFGCSDVFAGTLYGLWSTAGFFWSLVTFWVNDNFGVRKALLIGYCLSIVSTVILIASNSLIILYIVLLILSPLSYSVGPPMLIVGNLQTFS
jgi:dipeptide/tripeptide permease